MLMSITSKKCFDSRRFLEYQCEEIRKHKYIESEKAGRDLGIAAELEWVQKFAKDVRDWAESSGLFMKPESKNEQNQ